MGRLRADMTDITNEVSGKSVSHVTQPDPQRLDIHFTDDSVLAIALLHGNLTAALTYDRGESPSDHRHHGPSLPAVNGTTSSSSQGTSSGTEFHRLNRISHGTSSCRLPP